MLFGKDGLGAKVSIPSRGSSGRLDALLFGESQGRVVIAVKSEDLGLLEKEAESIRVPFTHLGICDQTGVFDLEIENQNFFQVN